MKTDEAVALLKAEMLMLAPNGNPISDLYYAVEMAIEALGDRFELNEYRQCGTVEECRSRMEWMAYSMDDVRRKFFLFVRRLWQSQKKRLTKHRLNRKEEGRENQKKQIKARNHFPIIVGVTAKVKKAGRGKEAVKWGRLDNG